MGGLGDAGRGRVTGPPTPAAAAAEAAADPPPPVSVPAAPVPAPAAPEAAAEAPAAEAKAAAPGAAPKTQGMFESLIQGGRLDREQVELAARLQQAGDPRRLGEILVDMGALHPTDGLQARTPQPTHPASAA